MTEEELAVGNRIDCMHKTAILCSSVPPCSQRCCGPSCRSAATLSGEEKDGNQRACLQESTIGSLIA